MRRLLLLAAAGLALAVPGRAAADPPDYGIVRPADEGSLSQLELGKQLYAGNCSMCHGSNGEGVTNPQPSRASGAMLGQGPPLTDLPAGLGTVDLYLRTGYMPLEVPTAQPVRSRVLLHEREIEALVAYVGSLQKTQPPEPIPTPHPEQGKISEGQNLFTEHCAGCHQVVAQGGYVTGARVPPLEDDSAVEIAECVRSGPYTMPVFPKSVLSDERAEQHRRLRPVHEEPGPPRRLAARLPGPAARGARDLVHRPRRARRHLRRDRKEVEACVDLVGAALQRRRRLAGAGAGTHEPLQGRPVAAVVLLLGRRRTPRGDAPPRIVRPGPPALGAEAAAIALFALGALLAVAFLVFYALDRLPRHTQLYGTSLGGAFVVIGAAAILIGKKLVVTEELAEEYPVHEHPDEQEAIVQVVEESDSRLTRKRLLLASGGAAAGALGLALAAPAVSFGPVFDMRPFYESGWSRGRRLVDAKGKPFAADEIEEEVFYTAFPEGGPKEELWSPLVLVRLSEAQLQLPPERRDWAPRGIVAYSKICTHAGCAISLYRTPKFAPVEAPPALVCPCHYSTFDPGTGGLVQFGPAGRRLPQLPLAVDADGNLIAADNFSEPVGPSWWGVRMEETKQPREPEG